MKLHLVDINPALVEAWREAFRPYPEVDIQHADLLAVAENTVVSPANSFGFMDGGIDRSFVDFFGHPLQARVQDAINLRPEGFLPVGSSLVIHTGHTRIPFLIVAPTMLAPEMVSAENSYRATRAVLRVAQSPEVSREVYCPGLGTGVGGVAPRDAAREMAVAYAEWKAR